MGKGADTQLTRPRLIATIPASMAPATRIDRARFPRVHVRGEPCCAGIGQRERFVLGVDGGDRDHRAEDLPA
jgi:hypothetical protein